MNTCVFMHLCYLCLPFMLLILDVVLLVLDIISLCLPEPKNSWTPCHTQQYEGT